MVSKTIATTCNDPPLNASRCCERTTSRFLRIFLIHAVLVFLVLGTIFFYFPSNLKLEILKRERHGFRNVACDNRHTNLFHHPNYFLRDISNEVTNLFLD